jgi:hypothetical protein
LSMISTLSLMSETETKPSLTVMSERGNSHRANWARKWSGMQSVKSLSRWWRGVHQGRDGIIWIINQSKPNKSNGNKSIYSDGM